VSRLNNNAQNIADQINTATNSIIGAVGALATLGSYFKSFNPEKLLCSASIAARIVMRS
jgi:hypothetical protein